MIGCIIQARTQSIRFPRKIYEDINGKYTLQRVLEGVFSSNLLKKIVLAMPQDDEAEFKNRRDRGEFEGIIDNRLSLYFGSSEDLMDRYSRAAEENGIDTIIRICADSPLIQGILIDEMIKYYEDNKLAGYLGNFTRANDKPYSPGLAIEIFSILMLREAMSKTTNKNHREHITPFMCSVCTAHDMRGFANEDPNTVISTRFDNISFDTPEDLELIKKIVEEYDKHKDLNKAILEAKYE